jgi:hypothetical protein
MKAAAAAVEHLPESRLFSVVELYEDALGNFWPERCDEDGQGDSESFRASTCAKQLPYLCHNRSEFQVGEARRGEPHLMRERA